MDEVTVTMDLFWIIIFTGVIGLIVIAAVAVFAWNAFSDKTRGFVDYEDYLEFLNENKIRSNIPKYLNDAYSDYLQKRNEFWSTYGQVIVAVFIVIILAILMLTKIITAEAGLPILSAVSGFAIAKGVNSTRNPTNPFDRDNLG
jgi:ABC-type sugar transport system permease subunit